MRKDNRANAAKYYDLNPDRPDDVSFYRRLVASPDAKILELGCGTGRVLLPLSEACGYIHGIDLSPAMISVCRKKLKDANIGIDRVWVEVGDIATIDLIQKFDLIIAPYRVIQSIGNNGRIDGLFESIRNCLSLEGSCVLNVFNPSRDSENLWSNWQSEEEVFRWEVPVEGGRVTCHEKNSRIDTTRLVLYPELIYRRYDGERLKEEAIMKIAMKCYYPGEFERLIADRGFEIINKWGGYNGEQYGEGPELIIQFRAGKKIE
jgi:SAM-dependent methyltransferase